MKLLIILAVVVAAIAVAVVAVGGGYVPLPAGFGKPTSKEGKPPSDQDDPVNALGRLEPESEIIDVSAPAGSRIDRLAVKEGDAVNKDAPLAYLDSHDELQAALNYAKRQKDEAQQRYDAETASGQAAVEEAKLRIRHAEEVMPLAIDAQKAEVSRCVAELNKSRLDLTRSKQLLQDKAITKSQDDGTVLVVQQCEEQLKRNQATLAHLQQDREIKLLQARAELKSAEANARRAQLSAQVDSLTAAVKLAEARLARTVILAPADGEVLKVLTRAGESVGRDPILKMGNTAVMYAVAEVYETDVRKLRKDQKATVTSKAFPDGTTLTGRVERISTLVRRNDVLNIDPTQDTDRRIIEARIRLDDSEVARKYNYLQVDVTIAVK